MRENHLSLFETAVKHGIPSDQTLRQWERIYDCDGLAGLFRNNRGKMKNKPRKPKFSLLKDMSLEAELEYLRAENTYLKN